MRKAVAIPYIIALIIGVIVVAVLAYWFISSGGGANKVGNEAQCTARKTEFCTIQTQDSFDKAQQICKDIKPATDTAYWCGYCKFIPNWKPSSGKCETT